VEGVTLENKQGLFHKIRTMQTCPTSTDFTRVSDAFDRAVVGA
jgi:hypothetical protein